MSDTVSAAKALVDVARDAHTNATTLVKSNVALETLLIEYHIANGRTPEEASAIVKEAADTARAVEATCKKKLAAAKANLRSLESLDDDCQP